MIRICIPRLWDSEDAVRATVMMPTVTNTEAGPNLTLEPWLGYGLGDDGMRGYVLLIP